MHRFFRSQFFQFETVRILGTARYGGAEVGEVLEAIGHIKDGDPVTWHEQWSRQAQKAEQLAKEAQCSGQKDAARTAFLRASNYTRASAYMMTGDRPGTSDPRVVPILRKAVDLFRQAIELMESAVHRLQIPYCDDLSLPAYLYLPTRRQPGKVPLVIFLVGADSMQEETYYMVPAVGPQLGYAVLTFEGPGQGLILHEHNVPMRPDWEIVIELVLRRLKEQSEDNPGWELDFDRIAVAGASLGGYFALRAAASPCIQACVAIDPVYDLWDFATRHVSSIFLNLWIKGWVSDSLVNSIMTVASYFAFQTRWDVATASRFLGVHSATETLLTMKQFSLRHAQNSFLEQVTCPTLVTGATESLYLDVDDHAIRAYRELKNPNKKLWLANTPDEGSLQAKMGAMGICNQRIFEYLDGCFGVVRDITCKNVVRSDD